MTSSTMNMTLTYPQKQSARPPLKLEITLNPIWGSDGVVAMSLKVERVEQRRKKK